MNEKNLSDKCANL